MLVFRALLKTSAQENEFVPAFRYGHDSEPASRDAADRAEIRDAVSSLAARR